MAMDHLQPEQIKSYFSTEKTVSQWWNPLEGLYRYHFKNLLRVIENYVFPWKDKRVLDVGTGRGMFSIWFAGQGCQVDALDISSEMLHIARKNAQTAQVQDMVSFSLGDAEDLSGLPQGVYDWVSCMCTFDHIPNLDKAVGQMAGKLKKDGYLLFTYCPTNSFHGCLFRLYANYISKYYKLSQENGLIARLYTHKEIERILSNHNLSLERRYGVGLFCLLLRPEFERGIITAIPRGISRLEEYLVPFYKSSFFAKRCQIIVGFARKTK